MARPRQRRKTRNPNSKVSRKEKHKMNISFAGVHPLIQQNWDKKKTLNQNYEAMGLVVNLSGTAGGKENQAEIHSKEFERLESLKNNVEWRSLDDEPIPHPTPAQELNPDYNVDEKVIHIGYKIDNKALPTIKPTNDKLISVFEWEAANAIKQQRHLSEQEQLIFNALISKHGQNYAAMARDLKLNKFQLTAGQLKRKMTRA